jgi:hypothetical protein
MSKEEEAEMPRSYSREQGTTWELNDYVKEMSRLLEVKLMERRREEEAARSARGDHDVRMSDANASAGGSMTAVPATTPLLESAIICRDERIPLVRLHSDTQNSDVEEVEDWYCYCGEWRKPTQAMCQSGVSAHLKVTTHTNAEGSVHTTSEWIPQETDDNPDEASSDDAWQPLRGQEMRDTLKFVAHAVGAPDTDDTARNDDNEEAELQEAMELSIQGEKTQFQAWTDKIGKAPSAPVEPGGNRPDIRTDMTLQLKEELDPDKTTQQTLSKTVVHTDQEIQSATAYVKANLTGDEAKADFETWNKGFCMWWRNVKVTNYDNLDADQILRLVIRRRLMSDEDEGERGEIAITEENLMKLYIEDFDNFIMYTRGERDHSVRITRLEAYKKALEGSPVNVAFRVTLFATTTSPWSLSRNELEWITYLFNAEHTMKKVRNMPKSELEFSRKKNQGRHCRTGDTTQRR